jgi:hypothetical protein
MLVASVIKPEKDTGAFKLFRSMTLNLTNQISPVILGGIRTSDNLDNLVCLETVMLFFLVNKHEFQKYELQESNMHLLRSDQEQICLSPHNS